ncbi:hypothetical protein SEA_SATIS_272 [Streptomyces phage Satis]|nr:hypothetical protein SEA_SATIS_272 [Streptomyces phage Satis]QBZ72158.1 hypothetical protein SEA_KRADAL_272 [Streptomyces phage Kradal]QPL14580.1 hypothetical protein SEA_EHYELIMAYOE_275 [Streptomyces phage EhyElimayoE]
MAKSAEDLTMREIHMLAAAKELADMLYKWNVIDELPMVVDDPRDGGSPYHHLDQALTATLKLLGTTNKTGFYEGVTSGMNAYEALENAKAYEYDGEV